MVGRENLPNRIIPLSRGKTVTQEIVRQLSQLIAAERWNPGDRLPSEFELAEEFQVGRGAIREALKALAVVGFVRVKRGKGTFVADRSDFLIRPALLGLEPYNDLQSLIEVRTLIEVETAGLAAARANNDEIQSIESFVGQMTKSIREKNLVDFLNYDVGFHFAVARASHNPLLSQCATLIRNMMQTWIALSVDSPQVAEQAHQQHKRILKAIQSRKPIAARNAMRRHLLIAASRWLAAAKRQRESERPEANVSVGRLAG
ncbi:MAG: FadR/GntR family transcriptional regulator [Acidobacteriota bacterium]